MIGNVNVPGALAADIANKVDKIAGKGLSTNDFTNEYKSQLDNMGDADDIAILKDFVFPKVLIPTDNNTTYTLTKGTRTITGTATSTNTEVSVPELGTWTCSFTNYGNNVSNTVTVLSPMASVTVEVPCYGVEWDGTSTTQWTRIGKSASFTDPVPYVAGASNYGSPFDNIAPWKNMVTSTDANAGTVVAIPKFYYRITQLVDNGIRIEISENPQSGFSICPACMDRGDGKGERDVIYIGRYHCDSTYKSTTGTRPITSGTRSDFRTNIHNLGSNIWQCDYATRFTIWLLYLVEFANWNSQTKIGYGCSETGTIENMGYTDSMPYHTGTTQSSRDSYSGTQYRNIEGLWDNVFDWMDGCYYNSNGLNVILNPSNFSDSSGGTLIGKPSGGPPSKFTISTPEGLFTSFYPSEGGGSYYTYSCDYWYFNGSYNTQCLYVGGNYNPNTETGLFYVYCTSGSQSAGYGSRLMVLP